MSLFATERVPQPVVVVGVVDSVLASRTLSVRPSELASGYERLNWRAAHQALVQAQETGWRTAQVVYASAPGAYQVAHVVPGPYQSLVAHFPSGMQAFQNLIGRPNLSAFVSVDRSTGRFISVSFRNRPRVSALTSLTAPAFCCLQGAWNGRQRAARTPSAAMMLSAPMGWPAAL